MAKSSYINNFTSKIVNDLDENVKIELLSDTGTFSKENKDLSDEEFINKFNQRFSLYFLLANYSATSEIKKIMKFFKVVLIIYLILTGIGLFIWFVASTSR